MSKKKHKMLLHLDSLSVDMIAKSFKRDNSIKEYASCILKVVQKLKAETDIKFDFIFEVKRVNTPGTYLLIDYRIIDIAYFYFIKKIVVENDFTDNEYKFVKKDLIDIENYFNINNYHIHFESTLNLYFILAKMKLVIFNTVFKIYKAYSYIKYRTSDNYIVNFQGVALNKDTLFEVFKNDENELSILKKMISRSYSNYGKNKSKKSKHYFNFENTAEFKKLSFKIENNEK